MKLILVVPGVIIVLAGITFALQGQGLIGPPRSFMFHNPDWILYGSLIILLGLIIIISGVVKRRRLDQTTKTID